MTDHSHDAEMAILGGLTARPGVITLDRLVEIIRLAPIGIGIVDCEGRTLLTNDALREMLGYTAAEFAAMPFAEYTHPDDVARNDELFARMMAGDLDRFEMDKRFVHRDGHLVWGHLIVSLLRDAQGRPDLSIGLLSDVTEERRLAAELEYLAYHDTLTKLPNRRLFDDRLTHHLDRVRRRSGPTGAVLFIDVDELKQINDTRGHQAGDAVLCALAERIVATLRPADTAGRLGGDEFGILLEDIDGPDEAEAIARRVGRALSAPVQADGHRVTYSVSVGVALLDAGMTTDEALRHADLAMYRAKDAGGGRIACHEP